MASVAGACSGVPMTTLLLVAHGGLAAALVIVSVFTVRARSAERLRKTTSLLLCLLAAQTVLGYVLYPLYLREVKPALHALNAGARSVADIFEVKEHLAFFALAMTLGAFYAARDEVGEAGPIVRVLVAGAHAAIVIVVTLGLVVASMRLP